MMMMMMIIMTLFPVSSNFLPQVSDDFMARLTYMSFDYKGQTWVINRKFKSADDNQCI